jgi:hypothetical protein
MMLVLWHGVVAGEPPEPPATPVVTPNVGGAADPRAFKKKRRYVLPDGTVVRATQAEINNIMLAFLAEQWVEPEVVKEAKEKIRQATPQERKRITPAKFPATAPVVANPVLLPSLQIDLDTEGALRAFVEALQERKRLRDEEEWLILTMH